MSVASRALSPRLARLLLSFPLSSSFLQSFLLSSHHCCHLFSVSSFILLSFKIFCAWNTPLCRDSLLPYLTKCTENKIDFSIFLLSLFFFFSVFLFLKNMGDKRLSYQLENLPPSSLSSFPELITFFLLRSFTFVFLFFPLRRQQSHPCFMKTRVKRSRGSSLLFLLPLLFPLFSLFFYPHAVAFAFSSSPTRASCYTGGGQQAHLLSPTSFSPPLLEKQQTSLFLPSFRQGRRKRRSPDSQEEKVLNGEIEESQRESEEDTWMTKNKISPIGREKHPFFFITPRLPLSLQKETGEPTHRSNELPPLRNLSEENRRKKKNNISSSLYSTSSLFPLRETLRGISFLPYHPRQTERRASLFSSSSFPSSSSSSSLLFSSFLTYDKRQKPSLSVSSASSSSLQAASTALPDIDRATAISCPEGGCRIVGVGSAVPSSEVTNDDLAQIVSTSDEWIRTRTGIRERRVLSGSETLRSLSLLAARRALKNANLHPSQIDLVLHASSSPDDLFGDATSISAGIMRDAADEAEGRKEENEEGDTKKSPGRHQSLIGPAGFDLTAACSGFLVGLLTGNAFLTSPHFPYRRILLVGGDALSRWVDWQDRNTCVLFGDGAGAVVLERNEDLKDTLPTDRRAHRQTSLESTEKDGRDKMRKDEEGNRDSEEKEEKEKKKKRGLLSYMLHSDGNEAHQLMLSYQAKDTMELPRAASRERPDQLSPLRLSRGVFGPLVMNGREVFKFVSRKVPPAVEAAVRAAGLELADVDWLVLHQANKRIIDAVAERLHLPSEKVLCNLDKYGNTSAASIPLCLDEAVREGKIKPGDVVVTAGFGAGLTWSAAVFRYG